MGMPVTVEAGSQISFADMLASEATPGTISVAYTGNLATGAINQALGSLILGFANRAFYCTSIVIKANCYTDMQLFWLGGALGTAQLVTKVTTSPVETVVIPQNKVFRPVFATSEGTIIGTAAVRKLLNADGTDASSANAGAYIQIVMEGFYLYDDLNFAARHVIKYLGDSIFNSVGRTNKLAGYDWKIRNFYALQNVRGVMKAASGSTSSNHEVWRQHGWHDEPRVSLLVYQLMVNDAVQSVSPATYAANLAAKIAMKKARWPRAKMLVLGCHPLQNATYEARAVDLRAQAAATVAAQQDGTLYFCDLGQLGTAFGSVNANYAASDGAGAGIHPSDAGDALIWGGNGTFAGLGAFLAANIPTL